MFNRYKFENYVAKTFGHSYLSNIVQKILKKIDIKETKINSNIRVALVSHVYYTELMSDIIDVYTRMPLDAALIITTTSEKEQEIRDQLLGIKQAKIFAWENRGRDVAPFVKLLNSGELDRFDLVLKIHTKRSPHLRDGDLRRKLLYAGLAGSRRRVAAVIKIFSDESTGMVGWRPAWRVGDEFWGYNRPHMEALCRRLGLPPPVRPAFFEGTMFWVRVAALAKVKSLNLDFSTFEAEQGQLDGTLHHALERTFRDVVTSSGYEVRDIAGKLLHMSLTARKVDPGA